MPETTLVINTGPVIGLVAALRGDLAIMGRLYERVVVPRHVWDELSAGGLGAPEIQAVSATSAMVVATEYVNLPALLAAELDPGEASVVQTALEENIRTVVIDEKAGRRIARLQGLRVTGSLGILLRAKREGLIPNLREPMQRMRTQGIWINSELVELALRDAGEIQHGS